MATSCASSNDGDSQANQMSTPNAAMPGNSSGAASSPSTSGSSTPPSPGSENTGTAAGDVTANGNPPGAAPSASSEQNANDPNAMGGSTAEDGTGTGMPISGGPADPTNSTPEPPGSNDTPSTADPSEDQTASEGEDSPEPADADPSVTPGPVAAGIEFSALSGTFLPPLALELSSSDAGEIRYTVDGSLPSADAPIYSEALALTQTTQVRAQLFVDGTVSSPVVTQLYVARDFEATSNIPILVVDGYQGGKPRDKELYHDAAFMLFEPVDGVADISASPTVVSRSGYRLRGQSSSSFEKTPFRVELWGEDGTDQDQPLAGLPAEADWGLIGPYVDRSLLRNPYVYDLGRDMGLEAPKVAWVELYINHSDGVLTSGHYEGVYWLSELIKNAKNRLNLKQQDEADTTLPDLSGGYIFSFEYMSVEGPPIECTGDDTFFRRITGGLGNNNTPPTEGFCWSDLELRDPKSPNAEQLDYITQYVHDFHATLHEQPLGDYAAHIDVASFVDHFIIAEFSRDLDAYNKSAYYHKDRDGLLKAGPLWDYNLSLAAGGFFDNTSVEGWQLHYRLHTTDWFLALAEDPGFMALVSARWKELRQDIFSDSALQQRLDDMAAPLAQAAERDFERWPVDSIQGFFEVPSGSTWEQQVQLIGDWMPQRAAWLDAAVDQPIDIEDYPLMQ